MNRVQICSFVLQCMQSTCYSNISLKLLERLEKLSLVSFSSAEAITRLQETINYVSVIQNVNTEGVEPLISTLENNSLNLRSDEIKDYQTETTISNAAVTESDYFVCPPGNVPVKPNVKQYFENCDQ